MDGHAASSSPLSISLALFSRSRVSLPYNAFTSSGFLHDRQWPRDAVVFRPLREGAPDVDTRPHACHRRGVSSVLPSCRSEMPTVIRGHQDIYLPIMWVHVV